MSVRGYVPLDEAGLMRIARHAELGPAPLPTYAVTPSFRVSYLTEVVEELEYAAMSAAAGESAAMRAGRGRRIVAAADVAEVQVDAGRAAGAVLVATAIPRGSPSRPSRSREGRRPAVLVRPRRAGRADPAATTLG